jgi:hypothetical protein
MDRAKILVAQVASPVQGKRTTRRWLCNRRAGRFDVVGVLARLHAQTVPATPRAVKRLEARYNLTMIDFDTATDLEVFTEVRRVMTERGYAMTMVLTKEMPGTVGNGAIIPIVVTGQPVERATAMLHIGLGIMAATGGVDGEV